MKAKRILVTLLAAMLLTSSAAADGAMTAQEMDAIWQSSLTRMNTESEYSYEDVPSAQDLSYEDALRIAREAIFSKYATPAEELDAMGVYPTFYSAEKWDKASWEFYFTPLRDANISMDHAPTGEGEYRVYIDSPSGEVTYCNWYIVDFWPYAQRTWDAGKQDVVYEEAKGASFFTQTAEQQEHFLTLLTDAGYDVSSIRSKETIFEDTIFRLDLNFGDPSRAVDPADDPRIAAAWQALEDEFGLDGELMRKYAYISFYSPLDTGTQDVYIAYSYELEWAMQGSDELPECATSLFTYATNLGYYLVQFDEETGEVLNVARRDRDERAVNGDPTKLLGRPQWDAADLVEFDAAYEHFCEVMNEIGKDNWRTEEGELIRDELMRDLGGDPELYNSRRESEDAIGLEAGEAIAREAAIALSGMTGEDFNAMFTSCESGYESSSEAYEYWFMGDISVTEDVYFVRVDPANGEVLMTHVSQGNG